MHGDPVLARLTPGFNFCIVTPYFCFFFSLSLPLFLFLLFAFCFYYKHNILLLNTIGFLGWARNCVKGNILIHLLLSSPQVFLTASLIVATDLPVAASRK